MFILTVIKDIMISYVYSDRFTAWEWERERLHDLQVPAIKASPSAGVELKRMQMGLPVSKGFDTENRIVRVLAEVNI